MSQGGINASKEPDESTGGVGDAYVRDRADHYVCVTSRSRNQ
jgi:hypothetical protein